MCTGGRGAGGSRNHHRGGPGRGTGRGPPPGFMGGHGEGCFPFGGPGGPGGYGYDRSDERAER
jgi:hypothetical protein